MPKYKWPEDMTYTKYSRLGIEDRKSFRERHGLIVSGGIIKSILKPLSSNGHSTSMARPHVTKNSPLKKIKKINELFPRTTDGASVFIRAWQKSPDAESFIAKYGDGENSFWRTATHRAKFFRDKGIALKKLHKSRALMTAAYDWDTLKLVAAEVAE